MVDSDLGLKRCTRCLEVKPHSQFGCKSWTNKDGSRTMTRKSHCRPCVSKSNLERYHTKTSTQVAHRKASYKHRMKSYGMTPEMYDEMLKDQQGRCAICATKPNDNRYLSIDHCHTTGKIRGLLCNNCNAALGLAKDNPDTLRLMIYYLESTK